MSLASEKYTGDEVLQVMSKYAINRNNYIFSLIKNCASSLHQGARVCEIGAGRGEFIDRLIKSEYQTYAIELDPYYQQSLSASHEVFENIDDVPDEFFDMIYLIDVLEHIEADQQILKDFYRVLKPNGKLLIYVPARMELYSPFDTAIGHFRRYVLSDLKLKVINADFAIIDIRYHELISYFLVLFKNKLSRQNSESLNPASVRLYDKIFIPITNFIEKFFRPPIGKSLICLASKPSN